MTSQHYAYIHCRPDGAPFYVGKGAGKRAYKFGQRRKHHKHIVAKYGAENILVGVIPCSTEALAFELEKGLIKCLRRAGVKLCNLTDGGEGASGRVHRPESIELMRRVQKGKVISLEAREKMAAAKRGRKLSPEHKAKILAKLHTPEARAKAAVANAGKKRGADVVQKIRDARRANGSYVTTEATRMKMSLSAKARHALWRKQFIGPPERPREAPTRKGSPEYLSKMARIRSAQGQRMTSETKSKIREVLQNRVRSQEETARRRNSALGKTHTPEAKARMSALAKQRPPPSQQVRDKIAETLRMRARKQKESGNGT